MATLYFLYHVAKHLTRVVARGLPPVPHEPVPATVCQPVTSDDILLRERQTEDVLLIWPTRINPEQEQQNYFGIFRTLVLVFSGATCWAGEVIGTESKVV